MAGAPAAYLRSHATLSSVRKGHHRRLLQKSMNEKHDPPVGNKRRKAPGALTRVELRDVRAREKNKAWLHGKQGESDQLDEDDVEEGTEEDPLRQFIRPSEVDESRISAEKQMKQGEAAARRQERGLARKAENDVELYYKDPLQLANGVLQRLKSADIDGALRLVRASEAFEIKNIVSWNHCVDWLMSQGEVKEALKVYNEMKKRGHKPDAYTYTLMLRGLSQHVNKPNVVKEAVKIYNSIFAPNSAVKPNTIHTNAIVNVCARGGDMDSLWAITGKLPEKGPGSPDRVTYTLILNAIRENTIRETTKTADKVKFGGDAAAAADSRQKMFEQAVEDGRKLWEDISYRWRRANLVLDEQLVCAMARLLLGCGVGKDVGQVLDLVESTMNLRIPERQSKSKQPSPFGGVDAPKSEEGALVEDGETNSTAMMPLKESNVYATPGQNTLSMLLEACYIYKPIRQLAPSYWHYMANVLNVEPDAANISAYLRILRLNRASTRVYELLAQDWPQAVSKTLYRRGTFVIAFAACARDKKNPNVFATAQKLLKLMQERLEERDVGMFDEGVAVGELRGKARKAAEQKVREELRNLDEQEAAEVRAQANGAEMLPVDPKVLQYFVELGVDTTKGWNEGLRGKDDGEVFERHPAKNHTIIALRTVAPHSGQLKRLLKAKLDEMQFAGVDPKARRWANSKNRSAGSRVFEKVGDLLELMRTMIGAYDKVLDMAERFNRVGKEPLDANLMADFNSKKREYTAYMARVEKTVGQRLKHAEAYEDVRERDHGREEDDEEDADNAGPDIERRIRAVLEGVDAKVLRDRQETKGFKNNYFPEQKAEVKIHSRVQSQTRDHLLGKAIERNFGKTDYGVLNEELGLENGRASKARMEARERQRTLSQPASTKPAKPRQPMIGDELGLDDEDDDLVNITNPRPSAQPGGFTPFKSQSSQTAATNQSVNFRTPRWQKHRDEVTEKESADWLLRQQRMNTRPMGRSILDNGEVVRAWNGEKSAASA
ncbi:hypothetical protein LTR70_010450 [Exophiala xenobiotica]|uniref:Pentatricopeptide repeat protein n=1 Tax=Lithohypha guttulata TaxID=1690604 RepID=A0ABR0JUB6_9EURO|nr:hypothetical protein LTR24_010420 [Lithohypha guttulata]KAK5309256.1 hypothetical protein LTR70_010450 [Exophiala xenobiotica]